MTCDQQEALIAGLRERRMRLRRVYNEVMDAKRKARLENVSAQVEKKLAAFHKKLIKVDEFIEDLEGKLASIQALQLEMADSLEVSNVNDPASS